MSEETNLDTQLGAITIKLAEIESLKMKRNAIKSFITTFSTTYDPVENPSTMMNPLNQLNQAMSKENIQAIGEFAIGKLAEELVAVELQLTSLISA